MEKRKLGKTDLEFAPIAFGGNVFGWTADEATSHKLLDAFVDAGFSFVDTADVYSRWAPGHKGGESGGGDRRLAEEESEQARQGAYRHQVWHGDAGGRAVARPYQEVGRRSLQRLNTDRVDLFQSHKDDAATPQEETLSTYGELVKAGKLRFIGASNFDAPRLAEAAKISKDKGLPRYESLQPHYNLVERPLFEGALEEECLKEGIGVIPYWPLAAGFLSGKYRTEGDLGKSPRGVGVKKYLNEKGLAVLKALDAAGKKHNASNVTVALAWLMQRKSITAPIVSATSLEQLKTLVAAPELKLDAEFVAALDKASA